MQDDGGSVTNWLRQLCNGDEQAAQQAAQQALWDRYFQRLATVARTKVPPAARRAADEEDIALSTLDSFFRATHQGRYPNVRGRTELWPLLVRIARCKAINQTERQFTEKRGSGRVRGDSALGQPDAASPHGFDAVMDAEPTPDSVVELCQFVEVLMSKLDNEQLREIARLKLSGHSNREIADKLRCVERTVARKLIRIQRHWLLLAESHP